MRRPWCLAALVTAAVVGAGALAAQGDSGQRAAAIAAARGHIVTGQLDSARTILRALTDSASQVTKQQRLEALILLGVVDHHLGADSLARVAFARALMLDSAVSVTGLRALSPDAADIFESARCMRRIPPPGEGWMVDVRWVNGECVHTVVITKAAELISGPRISYPTQHLSSGIAGRVVVLAVIDTTGRAIARSIRVKQTLHPVFDAIAVDYVRRARFRPGEVGGRKVKVLVSVPVDFTPPAQEVPTVRP
jgi:TonB family protein